MQSNHPQIEGVYETVVYGGGVATFSATVLGLRPLGDVNELFTTFRLPDGGTLLVVDPIYASAPGRDVPTHGAVGAGHVAFRVRAGELHAWRTVLENATVEIEQEIEWDPGGRSIYVRDPAGNSVELIEGEAWVGRL